MLDMRDGQTAALIRGAAISSTGPVVHTADDSRGGTSASRGRVLIVEDEFFVAMDAEYNLTAAGFTVIGIAATADAAVNLAETHTPDVVLMDIRLVGARDGIEAAAEIRDRFGVPSVFATAHSDPATRKRAEVAAAPLGWLSKPYSRAEVIAALAAALRQVRRD